MNTKETNESNLKILATKEDVVREIANLRVEMDRRFTEQLKRMIVMWINQLGALATIIKFMAP